MVGSPGGGGDSVAQSELTQLPARTRVRARGGGAIATAGAAASATATPLLSCVAAAYDLGLRLFDVIADDPTPITMGAVGPLVEIDSEPSYSVEEITHEPSIIQLITVDMTSTPQFVEGKL